MKSTIVYFLGALLLIVPNSCQKVVESAANCFEESLLVSIKVETINETKTIQLSLNYAGKMEVKSVHIDFGDGKFANSSNGSISHTYKNSGEYNVQAIVRIQKNRDSYCDINKNKTIQIN